LPNSNIMTLAAAWLAVTASAALGQAKSQATNSNPPLPRTQFIRDMDSEFGKMDADKNGQLTRLEIEQYQKLQSAAQAAARNRALFAQLDADKNGQLSKAEFAKIATPAPAANAQPILASRDLNRDGQVSLVEHRTATLANFDRIDADKDGYVTEAEMKAGGIAPR
jgi:Ca2+-binding EF-hand superfamily protein